MVESQSVNAAVPQLMCPHANAVLASRDFHPYRMADQYRLLQQNTGLNFEAAIRVLALLPVFLDGAEHKRMRKHMAQRMQASKTQQEEAVERTLTALFEQYFRRSGELDLVDHFATPVWTALSTSILQNDDPRLRVVDDIPLLFYTSLSFNKRKQINARIQACIDTYGTAIVPDLALASLGTKPLVGSLALSFYAAIERNQESLWGSYHLGATYAHSSLNFVDRYAKQDATIAGQHYRAGQRLRCVTQSSSYSAAENAVTLYGGGSHICLGKAIAQYTLAAINRLSADYPCRLTPLRAQYYTDREPFLMPQQLAVAVHV